MSNDHDLPQLSSSELAEKARDAIIARDADALDRTGQEMSRRAGNDREDGSEFQKIAKEHREKWQRRKGS